MEAAAIGLRPTPSGAKTADSRAQTRTPHSPSYIPLFSPKPARGATLSSSLPSSLSAPHLGLVPPNRTPSGSGPPSQGGPPLPSPPSAHASGGTALPSLRALRNFLPFSSGKPASSAAVPGPLKSPFAGFAPGRRSSLTVERKNSGQFPRPGDDGDAAVISIVPPSRANPERPPQNISTASADAQQSSLPSGSALHGDGELGPPVVSFKPDPPLSTELSTILESDLSGLSKHLPALDHSRTSDVSGNGLSTRPEAPPPSPGINELVAPDASVLDLSTSQLNEEVMNALKEKPSKDGWLTGAVVEDAADSRPASRNGQEELQADAREEPEESLHLDALDPDLAALLSPNRMREMQQSIFQIENPFASTTQRHQTFQHPAPPRIFPPPRAVTPQSRPSPLGSSPVEASPSSATTTGSARSQSSPIRTTSPHAYSSLARAAPTRLMPRIMRSVTDRAIPMRGNRSVENVARGPSDSALPLDDRRRVSIDSTYTGRSIASPIPPEFPPPPPLPPLQHNNAEPHRRVASARLATPSRFGTHATAASRLLRSALPSYSAQPGGWGTDSPSPSSRAPSALGSVDSRAPSLHATNRNRSLSVGGENGERVASPAPVHGTAGPRTAKAFAAAGLLDRDPTVRALAPSRLAMSEAGSAASSWRSGSVSRAMTHSEGTGHDSASTSTGAPRTTRSGESTAPTSISLSHPQSRTPSPQHKNYHAVVQAMLEKHATETGTLLAALADAQHNAQSLRAENAKLAARIEDLEAELIDTRAQLRAHQYASVSAPPPPPSPHLQPLSRAVFSRMERQASADAVAMSSRRRPTLPIPFSGHPPPPQGGGGRRRRIQGVVDLKRLEDADEEDSTYQGGGRLAASRRASGAESVFALPPPNMSLLLQELPAGSRRSVGSVSMTTASAPTDAPGSPGSLFLRPEHELHLGDLGSLDMRFTEDEIDDVGDDDSAL
ncbi:hypothetical protein BC826DRAFT_1107242 [Russula brevipes]|nr:hypothetical protein BC826DRAFT_1107242 [Russula brevipes]